MNTKRNSL